MILPNTAWGRCALNPAKRPGTLGSRAAALGRELVPSDRDDPKSQRITPHERLCMTTVLDEPRRPTQASGPAVGHHRVDESTYPATVAHGYLALSLAPAVISQVLQVREVTAAFNHGLNKVRFPTPVRVGSRIRAAETVMSAQQRTLGVESMFTISYEIDGEPRPACVADVIVMYP